MTRFPLPERAVTTDLFHDVALAAEKARMSFFLFGSSERSSGIAEDCIRQQYPGVRIVGRRNGYFSEADEDGIVEDINRAGPDILWVGLGMAKQTEFSARHANRLNNIGCIVTCGGLFDYFTPEVKRAPKWMQEWSLEWLFRTWQEPRKYLLRYAFTNPIALFLLLTRTRLAPYSGHCQVRGP